MNSPDIHKKLPELELLMRQEREWDGGRWKTFSYK